MKLLLADDHSLFRDSLAELLKKHNSSCKVNTVGDLPAVLATNLDDYQILLIDLKMPGMLGAISIKEIHNHAPNIPILIVSANQEAETIYACFQAGVSGYITKASQGIEFLDAIDKVLTGDRYIPKEYSPNENFHLENLSVTQLQLLEHIARGESNKQIAESLNLSTGTIKQYVSELLRKLNVDNRTQAANKANKLLGI